jgi:hypothetical protein
MTKASCLASSRTYNSDALLPYSRQRARHISRLVTNRLQVEATFGTISITLPMPR